MLSLLRRLLGRKRFRPATAPERPSTAQAVPQPRAGGAPTVGLAPARLPGWLDDLADPRAQLEAIAAVSYERVPLLNREEARLLPVLETCVRDFGNGHRVMAQVALGEVIRPRDARATEEKLRRGHASINAKRVDFLVIDRRGFAVVAIEYRGAGHFGRTAFLRDAVKREALRKAGVPTLEFGADTARDEVRASLRRLLAAERVEAAR